MPRNAHSSNITGKFHNIFRYFCKLSPKRAIQEIMSELHSPIVRTDDRAVPTVALSVEVIADLICPFCYLGKRRLDDALRAVKGPSEVSWHPLQLNPEMPAAGMPFEQYLSQRFGNLAYIQPVLDSLEVEGRREKIRFRFDKLTHVPNTLPAHQVMHLAANDGSIQSMLADALMRAFFERGENIGDTDVLVEVAGQYGLAEKDVRHAIEDEQTRKIVLSREAQVRASGMASVPGFLLNRRLLVVGAQSTETMINAFDQAMFGEGDDTFGSPSVH